MAVTTSSADPGDPRQWRTAHRRQQGAQRMRAAVLLEWWHGPLPVIGDTVRRANGGFTSPSQRLE